MEVGANHKQACEYIKNLDSLNYDELADALTYKWFRLNTLYHIKDKDGKKVLFSANREQELFYVEMRGRDLILKARQLGFTTFKMIYDLDEALFEKNHSAGCICHSMDSAKDIFRNKIKFAYQNITEDQRQIFEDIGYSIPTPESDKDNSYVFSNGSSIQVSTGYRGNTLQSLHVSEFGKICKKYPEKAKEIVTGAFESVGIKGDITIESTAEGRAGYFYEFAEDARKLKVLGKKLNRLDFNFHFFSWWQNIEYTLDGEIAHSLKDYFSLLENKEGIKLTIGQKSWYSAKWKKLGEDMKREYPSTPKEAFEQSIDGAYYSQQFKDIYEQKRITDVGSWNNSGVVNVCADIGIGDQTALWFYRKVGEEYHFLHYHANSGEYLGYYIKYILDLFESKKWDRGRFYAPHDMDNREYASRGRTRKELARDGIEYNGQIYSANFEIVPKLSVDDGIQLVRGMLPKCVFDEIECADGIKALESYRKEWNDKLGCWRDRPLHDWASDGSDSFRYVAVQEEGARKAATGLAWG